MGHHKSIHNKSKKMPASTKEAATRGWMINERVPVQVKVNVAPRNVSAHDRQIRNASITRRLNRTDNVAWRRLEIVARLAKNSTIDKEQRDNLSKATLLSHLLVDGYEIAKAMTKGKRMLMKFIESYENKPPQEVEQDIDKFLHKLNC